MGVLQQYSIKGTLASEITLKGNVHAELVLVGYANAPKQCDCYNGEYDITPKRCEQIIDVEGKHMLEDICVKEIPFYEVTNDSGGKTVKIGD